MGGPGRHDCCYFPGLLPTLLRTFFPKQFTVRGSQRFKEWSPWCWMVWWRHVDPRSIRAVCQVAPAPPVLAASSPSVVTSSTAVRSRTPPGRETSKASPVWNRLAQPVLWHHGSSSAPEAFGRGRLCCAGGLGCQRVSQDQALLVQGGLTGEFYHRGLDRVIHIYARTHITAQTGMQLRR